MNDFFTEASDHIETNKGKKDQSSTRHHPRYGMGHEGCQIIRFDRPHPGNDDQYQNGNIHDGHDIVKGRRILDSSQKNQGTSPYNDNGQGRAGVGDGSAKNGQFGCVLYGSQ